MAPHPTMSIDWGKSYLLTAEQVSLLGLHGKSVNDLDTTSDIPDIARLADAMDRLTVADLRKWNEQ